MGRKRVNPPPKPMLAVKAEFIDSLNNLTATGVALGAAIQNALTAGHIGQGGQPALQEALTQFERALFRLD